MLCAPIPDQPPPASITSSREADEQQLVHDLASPAQLEVVRLVQDSSQAAAIDRLQQSQTGTDRPQAGAEQGQQRLVNPSTVWTDLWRLRR